MNQDADHDAKAWVRSLPSLPRAAAHILAALRDEGSSWQTTAAALEEDPAITIRVLSLVNSPFYGVVGRVHSMGDAIQILGLTTLTGVVLASALRPPLCQARSTDFDIERFWCRALQAAQLARWMATIAELDADVGYLATILSKTGALLKASSSSPFREGSLDIDVHAVATLVGEQWGLPPEVVQVQRDMTTLVHGGGNEVTLPGLIAWAEQLIDMPPEEITSSHPVLVCAAEGLQLTPSQLLQRLVLTKGATA